MANADRELMIFLQIPPRGRTQQADRKVQCYEPATMKYLGYFPALTPEEVGIFICCHLEFASEDYLFYSHLISHLSCLLNFL